MAGLSLDGARGKQRRNVNAEINMIPMIDLFMVTICFLMLTTAWSHSDTLPSAVGGGNPGTTSEAREAKLHVDARGDGNIRLVWRRGPTVIEQEETSRKDLGSAIARTWKTHGSHLGVGDPKRDLAVLHVRNDASFDDVTSILDVIGAPIRQTSRGVTHAFVATLADD